jgi:malonyl-CoA decarboxylase
VPAVSLLKALDNVHEFDSRSALRHWLFQCAAHYLGREMLDGKPLDGVARFHLGNGARIERLNWLGDPSAKGLKQSFGLMVNYLYDLKRLDRHRSQLAQGKIPLSSEIEDMQF